MSRFKQEIIRSEKHRRFIASLPCCVTGLKNCQAAHIRSGCYSMGMKPCDSLTVPLHWQEHNRQHVFGEETFWLPFGGIEAAKKLAKDLYTNTGDYIKCCEIIGAFRTRPNF